MLEQMKESCEEALQEYGATIGEYHIRMNI